LTANSDSLTAGDMPLLTLVTLIDAPGPAIGIPCNTGDTEAFRTNRSVV